MKELKNTYKILKEGELVRLVIIVDNKIALQAMYTLSTKLIDDIKFVEAHGLDNLLKYGGLTFPRFYLNESTICDYTCLATIITEDQLDQFSNLSDSGDGYWEFRNKISVNTSEYDGSLRKFEVYINSLYLGGIYPSCIDDMKASIALLNSGEDPITGCWEDGLGHCCTLEGWGTEGGEE